jgi:hypothetical protein
LSVSGTRPHFGSRRGRESVPRQRLRPRPSVAGQTRSVEDRSCRWHVARREADLRVLDASLWSLSCALRLLMWYPATRSTRLRRRDRDPSKVAAAASRIKTTSASRGGEVRRGAAFLSCFLPVSIERNARFAGPLSRA